MVEKERRGNGEEITKPIPNKALDELSDEEKQNRAERERIKQLGIYWMAVRAFFSSKFDIFDYSFDDVIDAQEVQELRGQGVMIRAFLSRFFEANKLGNVANRVEEVKRTVEHANREELGKAFEAAMDYLHELDVLFSETEAE